LGEWRISVDRLKTICYNSVTIMTNLLQTEGSDRMAQQKAETLMYRNHPLRRIDKMIYYGSMADSHIILMQVKETKKEKDLEIATKVSVELQRTAPDLKSRDRVVKRSEKDSLYAAMDVSAIWLERALAGK